jgi:hypothetical protein
VGETVSVPDFDLRYPLVDQYSFNVEQQLPHGIALKIGYVGAHARNFLVPVNINQIPDNILVSYAGGTTNLSTKVTNPYYSKTVEGLPSTPFGVVGQTDCAARPNVASFSAVHIHHRYGKCRL